MQERFEMFTVLVAEIGRCIYRIKAEEMHEFALRGSHVNCLYYLYKKQSMTAKALCDESGEDKANMSRAVRFLEENGYLTCSSTAAKRYQSPLELTEKGKDVGRRIAEKVDAVLAVASEGVTEEERTVMYRVLGRICDNLRGICDAYETENTEDKK